MLLKRLGTEEESTANRTATLDIKQEPLSQVRNRLVIIMYRFIYFFLFCIFQPAHVDSTPTQQPAASETSSNLPDFSCVQNPPAVVSTPSASSVAPPPSQISDEVKFEFDPESWIPRRKRAREEDSDDEASAEDSRKRQTRDDVTTTADDFDDIPDRTTQRRDAEEDEAVQEPPAQQSHEVKRQESDVDTVISADVMDFLNDTGGFLSSRQRRVGVQLLFHRSRVFRR